MADPARVMHIVPVAQDHTKLEEAVALARGIIDESYGLDPTYDALSNALDEALVLLGREDLR